MRGRAVSGGDRGVGTGKDEDHIEVRISLENKLKLDLETIGSSLRFEGELIWAGLDWRGPDITSGLVIIDI